MTPLRTAILASIGPMGARTASEVAAEIGDDPLVIQRVMRRMERDGQLTASAGFYRQNHKEADG